MYNEKNILPLSIIIITISISIFIYLNVAININSNNNKEVLNNLNKIFLEQDLAITDEYTNNLPKIEIDGNDYIGIINIPSYNLSLPIKSICNNSFLSIESACTYSKKSLTILGTNLNNSFYSFELYTVNDQIMFTNTLGNTFQYKIKKITRIDNIEKISQYNEDLIIVIKNYYDMKYILLICDFA